jgi:isopenicillin N synthase-like dioxygenase
MHGGWISAPPIPQTLVINIGDMMERLTGGRFQSTPHRVRNQALHDRLSWPFFFDPSWDAVVRPLPLDHLPAADVSQDRHKRWDKSSVHTFEGTYGQYLLAKVGKVFPDLAEQKKIASAAAPPVAAAAPAL